jgi:hypothetical protein
VIFTFDIFCCEEEGLVPFTGAVPFCAYAATLLQRAKINSPKANNSARFPFPLC